MYPDYKYDAFIHYLKIIQAGDHPLWGDDPVFVNYSVCLGKQCNSQNTLGTSSAWRQRFKLMTNKFELSEDGTSLLRNGKKVLREGEYEGILVKYHDEAQHPSIMSLRAKVSMECVSIIREAYSNSKYCSSHDHR